jgi:hypothetical protein
LALAAALAACAGPNDAGRMSPDGRASAPAGSPADSPDLKKLSGLSDKDVQRALGEPDFRREEPPAQIWQYRSPECVLDLFLYEDTEQYWVAYAETHDRGFTRVSQTNCYAGLVDSRSRVHQGRL